MNCGNEMKNYEEMIVAVNAICELDTLMQCLMEKITFL